MVCVVLHERGATRLVRPHDLEDPHERRGLPVALATEAVALGHETLHGDTGKLSQSAEVFEVRREGGELAAFEKRAQTSLDTGRVVQRSVTGGRKSTSLKSS